MIRFTRTLPGAIATAVLGAAMLLPSSATYAADGAFADYAGHWSGSGTISIANNDGVSRERIRQIEVRAFEKLQAALLRLAGERRLLPAA